MKTLLISGIFLLFGASLSSAQTAAKPDYRITVSGTVQSRDGMPLKGAEVAAGDIHAVTNDSGAFVLPNVPGGYVFILVRRIGYLPGTLAFESEPTLRSMTIAAVLTPTATTLGTIVVEGKILDQGLWKNGFYRRRDLGFGYYFDPAWMARTGMNLSAVVQQAPSIRIERRRGGVAVPMVRLGTDMCALHVFLDGQLLPWAGEVGIDNIISSSDVHAVEVYPRGTDVPAGFSFAGKPICGAIMLWSRSEAPSTSTPSR